MEYCAGYKYQLRDIEIFRTGITLVEDIVTDFIVLSKDGTLYVMTGYAWDGATMFPDLKSIIRGSAGHDALYQIIRMGLLSKCWRKVADTLLRKWCVEDGMFKWLAEIVYLGVQKFGEPASSPKNRREILTAP